MAETTKEDRKLVKARFFEIDKTNTNLSYNFVEVLELLKRALNEKPKISDRQLILNKINNDGESDIPALLKEYNINNDLIFWSCLTVLLSFIFGFITSKVTFCQKQGLKESNKESELRSKIYDSTQNGEFVQVTLNSRKVYVGVIVRNINEFVPTDSECIVISPYRSGYRDKDTLVINFTNEYTLQHQEYIKTIKLKAWFRLNRIVSNYSFFKRKLFAFKYRKNNPNTMYFKYLQRFAVVIPVSDIASISYFDLEVFKNINNNTCSKDNL